MTDVLKQLFKSFIINISASNYSFDISIAGGSVTAACPDNGKGKLGKPFNQIPKKKNFNKYIE